jgi:hypothetical protein
VQSGHPTGVGVSVGKTVRRLKGMTLFLVAIVPLVLALVLAPVSLAALAVRQHRFWKEASQAPPVPLHGGVT